MPTTPFRYLLISPDGTTAVHRRDINGINDIAAIVTDAVGGWFTTVPTDSPSRGIWYNEEGLLLQFPTNRVATAMVSLLGGPAVALVGPVVITGQSGEETHGLT